MLAASKPPFVNPPAVTPGASVGSASKSLLYRSEAAEAGAARVARLAAIAEAQANLMHPFRGAERAQRHGMD